MRILIIEDDKDLAHAISTYLESENFHLQLEYNGADGLYHLCKGHFDLAVLDRMLPEMSGLDILKRARHAGVNTPVLMMTAMGQITDKVDGLEAGADDYIVKPFDNRELLARIKALLRRPTGISSNGENLEFLDISLKTASVMLTGELGECKISAREADILKLFLSNKEEVIPRDMLFAKIWGHDADVEDANIDSYIYYVRRRLKAVSKRVIIKTMHGVGYRLEEKND